MSKLLHTLIVEDSLDDARLLVKELRRGGYEIAYERVETAEALKSTLAREPWDIVFCDFTMPHFSGQMALRLLHEESRRQSRGGHRTGLHAEQRQCRPDGLSRRAQETL